MHHAYIYEGAHSLLPALASHARHLFGFTTEHDPDVSVQVFEKFGIEEARQLRETAALKSVSGRGLFVIGISSITTEAQQALLKLFEEPQKGVVFVVLVAHGALIATLRSRFLKYPKELQEIAEQNSLVEAKSTRGLFEKQFLSAPYKTRSTQVTALLKDEDGVRERVRDFLNEIEKVLYAQVQKKSSRDLHEGLADIAKVRSYLGDRSPALKMLLEHLAATLPNI